MIILFALLVAKTYIIILYDLPSPQRSNDSVVFPRLSKAVLGIHARLLIRQIPPPRSQTPINMQLTNFGLKDEVRRRRCERLLVFNMATKNMLRRTSKKNG